MELPKVALTSDPPPLRAAELAVISAAREIPHAKDCAIHSRRKGCDCFRAQLTEAEEALDLVRGG
jgi:hypothetical protein